MTVTSGFGGAGDFDGGSETGLMIVPPGTSSSPCAGGLGDTGGSCDTCETQALLTLDGRWKRYGNKWQSTPASEQRVIRLREPSWKLAPRYPINNTVLEDPQPQ